MKNILVLISSEISVTVNRYEYLSRCMMATMKEGFMPISPDCWPQYTNQQRKIFIASVLSSVFEIWTFIDYGKDGLMAAMHEGIGSNSIRVSDKRLDGSSLFRCMNSPIDVLHEVTRLTGYSVEALSSPSRKREYSEARFIYFRRSREITNASLNEIGSLVGRDHASVLHGIRVASNVREIINKYTEYYGPAKEKTAPVDVSTPGIATNGHSIEGEDGLLPHKQVERREPGVQGSKSVMPSMRGKGPYLAVGGYGSHNTAVAVR